ncbi:hypothetical protein TNCV_4621741 [Trichonephila clavipes]|nr:hypothetical protein TNCV_4621741 [Trichonephila clavipes]
MAKSVVSVADIVGYNRCHMPRHGIQEAFDVSLGYSNPCGIQILPKFIWCSIGWWILDQLLYKHGPHAFDCNRSDEQAGARSNLI